MDTFSLLIKLSGSKSKKEYLQLLDKELIHIVHNLTTKGYQVHKEKGFVNSTNINPSDFFDCHYFSEVLYINSGLTTGNWTEPNTIDSLFYIGVKGFVTDQFNSIP